MKEIDSNFIEDSLHLIEKRAGTKGVLKVSTSIQPMDQVIVGFHEDGLTNIIAQSFTTDERWHFFAILSWQVIAPYLIKLKVHYPELSGTVPLWLDDVSQHAGLVFTSGTVPNQFALPDRSFVRSNGYEKFRNRQREIKWSDRNPKAFWRGATTGYRSLLKPDWRDLPRMRLCAIAASHESIFDVGISNIVQIGDPDEVADINQTGWVKDKVPAEQFGLYKTTIDIDGNANSWEGFFIKMLMNTTILKVTSEEGFCQWYYDRIIPWKHFVPVLADMSDLVEKALWVNSHEAEAEAIACNGCEFANGLTIESTLVDIGPKLDQFLKVF